MTRWLYISLDMGHRLMTFTEMRLMESMKHYAVQMCSKILSDISQMMNWISVSAS